LLLIGDALGTTDPTNAAALADLRRAVDVLGLQARVHWTGHCQPAEVAGWLRCLDVAVLPFADGASPRRTSILAAWANGVPVLTTTPASADGWPTDPAPAVTVPPGDDSALATALHQVLRDQDRREALVRAGAAAARRSSWREVTAQTLVVYEEALARAGLTPAAG
jgi:glycosyltransferase involved in cell wall biosynthesis